MNLKLEDKGTFIFLEKDLSNGKDCLTQKIIVSNQEEADDDKSFVTLADAVVETPGILDEFNYSFALIGGIVFVELVITGPLCESEKCNREDGYISPNIFAKITNMNEKRRDQFFKEIEDFKSEVESEKGKK